MLPFEDYRNNWGDPLRQIILNVLMLVPFGLLFPVCRKSRGKKCGFLRVFLCTLCISLSIELIQPLLITFRSSDITDVITNTFGGVLGYLLQLPLRKPISRLIEKNGTMQITLGRVTKKRLHEYYKGFVSDTDIIMDMSRFFEYRYDSEKIDAYWAARKPKKDRKDFFILLSSKPIGELSLKHINYEKKECELSIHLQNDSVKNKGYGTEAVRLAVLYSFDTLGMERVLAGSVLKNKRSQHVLEKVGFVLTGSDECFRYYCCDRSSFQAKREEAQADS